MRACAPGDRLDLAAMRCAPVNTSVCASLLSQWGGVNYVMPRTRGDASSSPRPGSDRRARSSSPPSRGPAIACSIVVVVLSTIAGVLVVLGAAWLVWTRPGPMTWGFFVYVIQFNPGQAFQFWAWLQLWPPALLAQDVIFLVMQAAAYTGLLAVCAEGAGRPGRRPMADDRARSAGSGDRVPRRRAR